MDFSLSEEQRAWQMKARKFADEEITPISLAREQIADPKGMGTEQIGLESDQVAIAAGHLQHRFHSLIQQQPADRQAAHPHHRPAAIGDIHGMDKAPQCRGRRQGSSGIRAPRGCDFRRDRKVTPFQSPPQQHDIVVSECWPSWSKGCLQWLIAEQWP